MPYKLVFSFQSTPPSRVATVLRRWSHYECLISIHTTLAGGDGGAFVPLLLEHISIHTTLAGGDWRTGAGSGNIQISIHTTLAGGDVKERVGDATDDISIHTTLAGGDRFEHMFGSDFINFNPHHPRGWRHSGRFINPMWSIFQSTPPSRVATADCFHFPQ